MTNDQINIENNYEWVFNHYYKDIVYFINSYLYSIEDSQELAQDVFVSIWENREKINTIQLKSYIYTIAKHKSINFLKKRISANKYANEIRSYDELSLCSLQSDSVDSIFVKEIQESIDNAVESLPEKCKEVFLLSRKEGLKYSEIADKLNISPKTVENHMAKAIRNIRLLMEEHAYIFFIFFLF